MENISQHNTKKDISMQIEIIFLIENQENVLIPRWHLSCISICSRNTLRVSTMLDDLIKIHLV